MVHLRTALVSTKAVSRRQNEGENEVKFCWLRWPEKKGGIKRKCRAGHRKGNQGKEGLSQRGGERNVTPARE